MAILKPTSMKVELLNPQKFINANNLQQVTNPIFFKSGAIPTSDGLLSNDIFGISKNDRSNRFAYIDLNEEFLHPLAYRVWSRLDSKIADCVHGTKKFIIKDNELVEDPNGKTGISFLKKNIENLTIKRTTSRKRDINIEFISKNMKNLFIKQCIVIPAYYRDVNTESGTIGVGDVNKLYTSLIISTNALKETQEYGLNITNATKGRIQETLVKLYDWFSQEPNLAKKHGIIQRAGRSKTADYASRLVISSASIDYEHYSQLMVDLDHSAVPLSSLCVNLYPYIIFYVRRFLENEFTNRQYPYMTKGGKVEYVDLKDTDIEFSDDRIKKELNRYIRGFSNRFIPIYVPNHQGKKIKMRFKGRMVADENVKDPGNSPLLDRDLTWCDLFYMAAVEAAKDKHVLITRYPLSDYFGQFPTKIIVSSTKDTEPMFINNKMYPNYPKIRQEYIGTDTSNMFVDTLQMSNLHLIIIGGDFDGDQVTAKVAYTTEANDELSKHIQKKAQYIGVNGINVRVSEHESVQVIYNLTKVLDQSRLTEPVFGKVG